jgi:hypothetical protein
MPFNVSRAVNTVEKEILKFPAGLDAIESVVLRASGVDELPSAVTGIEGKLGLRAGTILTRIPGDTQNRYKQFEGAGGEVIEGILGDNVFFYDESSAADEPADMLFHGCVFRADKIIDYATHETALKAALNTSKFDESDL